MFLADYHMHSFPFSPDAHNSIYEMAMAAVRMGMTHICVTNHIENCAQTPASPMQFPPMREYEALKTAFDLAKDKVGDLIDMRLGAEVGCPHFVPHEGLEIYKNPIFDFIIGSIHNLRDYDDFYYIKYPPMEEFRPVVEKYLQEHISMVRSGLCDVIGHIGYMQKYMARQGLAFRMIEFSDLLEEIFKAAVEMGIGIEVNTSSLHDSFGDFVPNREVLQFYRQCGGEIITVGSDAHNTEHVGFAVEKAYALLKDIGFKYVAIYRAHKPEFIKI